MTLFSAIVLGCLQGLTEFLPVSSSAHLALAQLLMPGFQQPGLVFDVALHLGTTAAVLALEWRRLWDAFRGRYLLRMTGQLGAATVVTAAVGLPLRRTAERAFEQPLVVAAGLALTGLLLLSLTRLRGDSGGPANMPWRAAVLVGLTQGVAVMPGVSRSGSTIVVGVRSGLERRWAADFSFLLSVPAILGAAVVEGWSHRAALVAAPAALWWTATSGAVAAALVGGAALLAVRRRVHGGRLHLFAYYVLPLAVVTVVLRLAGVW